MEFNPIADKNDQGNKHFLYLSKNPFFQLSKSHILILSQK